MANIFNDGIYCVVLHNDDPYFKKLDETFDCVEDLIEHCKEVLSDGLGQNDYFFVFGTINDEDFAFSTVHKTFKELWDSWLWNSPLIDEHFPNVFKDFVDEFAYHYLEDELFSFRVDDVYENEITLIADDSNSVYHGEPHELLLEDNFYEMVDTLMNTDVKNAVEAAEFVEVDDYDSDYNENEYYDDAEPTGEVKLYIKPVVKNYQKISI